MLLDNITKKAIEVRNPGFSALEHATKRIVDRSQVKGQLTNIKAWEIPKDVLCAIR